VLNGNRYTRTLNSYDGVVDVAGCCRSRDDGIRGFRVGREFGDCDEGWIYPGGGSELHFPGHEWQINKQFAFVGNGRQWGKNNLRRAHRRPAGTRVKTVELHPFRVRSTPSQTHTHTQTSPSTQPPLSGHTPLTLVC